MQTSLKYLLVAFCSVVSVITTEAQTNKNKPNIIVILADDLGWKDLSCYGSTFYETPNLDALATKGIKFTNNYTTSPVCSPTRSSMMTGKNPINTKVTDWIKGRQENGKAKPFEKLITPATAFELSLSENTMAEHAMKNGYQTFFAGKWHLGEEEKYWPLSQGFQTNLGGWSKGGPYGKINDSTGGYFTPYSNPTLPDGPAGEYVTDRLANECISFIQKEKQSPFFLMYSLYAVHNPLQAPQALIRKYKEKQQRLGYTDKDRFVKNEAWMKYENDWKLRLVQDHAVYAAMIENMDWNIGRIIQSLKEKGLLENTLIIFTSDNGGLSTAEGSPTTNTPLRAGKGWLYEGGIRVPMVMYWKDKLQQGTVSDIPVTTSDIFSTVVTAMNKNYKKEPAVEGENILKLLSNRSKSTDRALYWYYPHYSNQGGKPGAAIRKGNYKLIYHYEDESIELYDISVDIGEKKNLAAQNVQVAKQLKNQLDKWLASNKAGGFTPNPGYKQ
ncbi:sulfatase [Lacibacter sediminis]|uniref:Sulfatase n=1 Tax=Lacibacter sediminis TaxID=2760713 RepID=A0A7G5XKI9_9BACT|nr:sulfatase [Lacibacter sediminis]QNA45992.1 sulfatase [Lacibacter sediminis]